MENMRKVAIVARHPKSRYRAPFGDNSWEIWTLSPFGPDDKGSFTDLPRWDRFYEMHSLTYLETQVKGAAAWLKAEKEKRPESVWFREDFPVDEIIEKLGACADYFTNSVAEMLAHALYEGVDELAIYGVDMAHESEYYWQRPCVEYWLGRLVQSGCKITVPAESDLLKHTRRYGLQEETPQEVNLSARRQEIESRIVHCEQNIETNLKHTAAMVAAKGEIGEVRKRLNGHADPELDNYFDSREADLSNGIQSNRGQYDQLQVELWMLKGCLEENKYHVKLM